MEPTGYFIAHHRMTDTQYFGPFQTIEEAETWNATHPDVHGGLLAMYLDVDWNRRS